MEGFCDESEHLEYTPNLGGIFWSILQKHHNDKRLVKNIFRQFNCDYVTIGVIVEVLLANQDCSDWIKNVTDKVRHCIKTRAYRITSHARKRQEQYSITLPELIFVLLNGFHEKDKTLFDNKFGCWKYAIRGKTLDAQLDLRVIVAFANEMAILTVIKLNKRRRK